MFSKLTRLSVQVLGPDNHPTLQARVILQIDGKSHLLNPVSEKGMYAPESPLPVGVYELTVEQSGYETDKRTILLKGEEQRELFLLRTPDTPYYYRGKVKTPYIKREDKLVLLLPDPAPQKEKRSSRKGGSATAKKLATPAPLNLEKLVRSHKLRPVQVGENLTKNGFSVYELPKNINASKREEIQRKIQEEQPSVQALPLMRIDDESASLLTNEILVRFEDYVTEEAVKDLLKEYDLEIVNKMVLLGNHYQVKGQQVASYEYIETCNKLAERSEVVFAEPNLIHTIVEDAITPSDYLYPEQWDLNILNTGDAWQFLRNMDNDLTYGSPNVIIGVVDSGIDPNHPDFSGNVSDGSSKIYQAYDFENMVANNNSMWNSHGTSCASAAASLTNNASGIAGTGEGVAGVAGNCRVLGIRRGGDEARYANMYLWAAGFDAQANDASMPAQIDPGADVLSSSIAESASVGSSISGTMQATFDRLTDDGRDGKGTLLFFSAGNDNGDLDTTFNRPWGMYNRCFSVAASTLANNGVTETRAPYSAFGSVVEFCAPSSDNGGIRLHNPTANYGTFTASTVPGSPLQTLTLTANVAAGANQLQLSQTLWSASNVLFIQDGANSEYHFFQTVNDAAGNRTNRCTLLRNLANAHTNGVTVQIFSGYTPGLPAQTNTLDGAVVAGATVLTLDDATGFTIGQGILIGDPGNANTEANIIHSINGDQVTLGDSLFNAHPDNTPVSAGPANYRNNFGGTSHATPLCAGVAALMLSANPDLTWTEVRDIMRETAVKIDPNNTNATGRWRDTNGRISTDPAYTGPSFSEFYGFGRIDAAAAVREAGWDIELVTNNLEFIDVPESETRAQAVRFNVKSRWTTRFEITAGPGADFDLLDGNSIELGPHPDSTTVREAYLWITYTGTNNGDSTNGSVTVRCTQTEQEWIVPISANTITRPSSAIMLALDRSASMDWESGIGNNKRIDVLHYSANILVQVMNEGNGIGIVAFDHDPHDVLIPAVGPLPAQVQGGIEPTRVNIQGTINNFAANPLGNTAIGDGIARAQQRLNDVNSYDSESVIVFTDGHETAGQYIADVSDQVNSRVFAIGLGRAENIQPTALNAICNGNDGYLLLTDQLGADSIFKLAKYFLQIQAAVNNEDVIVDPNGILRPGDTHRIPFTVADSDISADVILMVPKAGAIDISLETPHGETITPSDTFTLPGSTYVVGDNVQYFRLNLPVPVRMGEHAGRWHVVLKIDTKFNYYNGDETLMTAASDNRPGLPYTLLVHAYSNLRMRTALTQSHNEPGAELFLRTNLTEYGVPLGTPCSVTAELTEPDGAKKRVILQRESDGVYTATHTTRQSGIYHMIIRASGTTHRGRPFTREEVRTGAVWAGGNQPAPKTDTTDGTDPHPTHEHWCALIKCLTSDKNLSPEFRNQMKEMGINIDGMIACLEKYYCRGKEDDKGMTYLDPELFRKLQSDYTTLMGSYQSILNLKR